MRGVDLALIGSSVLSNRLPSQKLFRWLSGCGVWVRALRRSGQLLPVGACGGRPPRGSSRS